MIFNYLIRDVWLQSSDHFKSRLLFKPPFSILYSIPLDFWLCHCNTFVLCACSHSEHNENKTQSKKYMSNCRSQESQDEMDAENQEGDGRVASEYWPRPGNNEEWIMSNVDGAEIGNWMLDKSPRHRSKSLSRWRTSKELTSPERWSLPRSYESIPSCKRKLWYKS